MTGPRTAGQSGLVMDAVSGYEVAQRENLRDETNETRRLEDRKEVDGTVPSQAEIQCECAFTYMNAVSRKNLTDARAVNANDVRTALDTGAAFGGVTGIAPSRRMIVTCM